MKLASVFAVFLLVFALAVPAYALGAENVALDVSTSDLVVSVPLCSYWYKVNKEQGNTPKMTVTNHGFSPISVTAADLPGSMAILTGIPCDIMPTMHQNFALTEPPTGQPIAKRAVKQQVIFTISKIGG